VIHVQENAPEVLAIKQSVFAELDRATPENAVIASSSSALVPSSFTGNLRGRARCLVIHPINPPYLIPAVEILPAAWTSPEIVTRAKEFMEAVGQAPIMMRKEIDGFVMNRMQAALMEEAMRLVEDGICSVDEVDVGIREGLALRWAFIGPFETIDLNAPGGARDYVTRYHDLFKNLYDTMQRRANWLGPLLDTVERERRAKLPAEKLGERTRWRDRRLMALLRHKQMAAREIGD
jgi:3-hydroxyacyl-CoA dehydrogenase